MGGKKKAREEEIPSTIPSHKLVQEQGHPGHKGGGGGGET